MASSKFEESFDREAKRAIELGVKNAEYIRLARGWCEHFRIKMVSAGYLAHVTSLPIGSHAISCQFAEDHSEAMNLPWIIPEFIVNNCIGCQHHAPNGDAVWGTEIIDNHKRKLRERAKQEQEQQNQLDMLRVRLHELSKQAKQTIEPSEEQILNYVERMFSSKEDSREEYSELLVRAAQIGADLFPPIAIKILTDQSRSEEFAQFCLPVCCELAGRRDDLVDELKSLGLAVLKQGVYPELAARILLQLGEAVDYPLQKDLLGILVRHQQHSRIIGSWYDRRIQYPSSNEIILRSYGAQPSSVLEIFRVLLERDDKYVRINACGVIKALQENRPQIGLDLLPDLVNSLELYDDPYEDSADGRARQCIAEAFRSYPAQVDEYLVNQIIHRRPAVQQEIVSIYRALVQDTTHGQNDETTPTDSNTIVEISLERCRDLLQDEMLDLEVRIEAIEVIEAICSKWSSIITPHFDLLLGYYAIVCTRNEPPPPPPRILLPGQNSAATASSDLESWSRTQNWTLFKDKLLSAIQKLAEKRALAVSEPVIRCYQEANTKTSKELKVALIALVGTIGKEYALQPRVLPLLMQALMDFDSQVLRASAIRAVENMYRYSKSIPPKDLVDIIVLHLRDQYVIVHKAAIRVLRWKARWLNEQQAIEALNVLIAWLPAYKGNPHFFEDLCAAIIHVAAKVPSLKDAVFIRLTQLYPTNNRIADERLAEKFTQHVAPEDRIAEAIAPQVIWYLGHYGRDRYNNYDFNKRAKLFLWLQQLPNPTYTRIKTTLVAVAQKVAAKDPWESIHFASLFSHHGDHVEEETVLTAAIDSLKGEKRYEKFRGKLVDLKAVATANIYLQQGKDTAADQLLRSIKEIEE